MEFSGGNISGLTSRGWAFTVVFMKKSASFHDRCLKSLLRAPISLYETLPTGQILSYWTRHLFLIDSTLPDDWLLILSFIPLVLGSVLIVLVVVPWVWATLPLFLFMIWVLVVKCSYTEERLRELEAANRAPLFAHVSSTLEGLYSLRVYQVYFTRDPKNVI